MKTIYLYLISGQYVFKTYEMPRPGSAPFAVTLQCWIEAWHSSGVVVPVKDENERDKILAHYKDYWTKEIKMPVINQGHGAYKKLDAYLRMGVDVTAFTAFAQVQTGGRSVKNASGIPTHYETWFEDRLVFKSESGESQELKFKEFDRMCLSRNSTELFEWLTENFKITRK